jgi:hypothetical protein
MKALSLLAGATLIASVGAAQAEDIRELQIGSMPALRVGDRVRMQEGSIFCRLESELKRYTELGIDQNDLLNATLYQMEHCFLAKTPQKGDLIVDRIGEQWQGRIPGFDHVCVRGGTDLYKKVIPSNVCVWVWVSDLDFVSNKDGEKPTAKVHRELKTPQ